MSSPGTNCPPKCVFFGPFLSTMSMIKSVQRLECNGWLLLLAPTLFIDPPMLSEDSETDSCTQATWYSSSPFMPGFEKRNFEFSYPALIIMLSSISQKACSISGDWLIRLQTLLFSIKFLEGERSGNHCCCHRGCWFSYASEICSKFVSDAKVPKLPSFRSL